MFGVWAVNIMNDVLGDNTSNINYWDDALGANYLCTMYDGDLIRCEMLGWMKENHYISQHLQLPPSQSSFNYIRSLVTGVEAWQGGTTRCVEEVCLQCLARPMNMAPMFCLSGVIARLGASGDQCAVPETMSRSTLPYWPQSPDPELTPDPWWDTPELELEEKPSGEYLATLTKLKVSQIQIREILQSTTFLWSLEFWCV